MGRPGINTGIGIGGVGKTRIWANVNQPLKLTGGKLAITWDECNTSEFVAAFPILQAKNAKSTFYVTSTFPGQAGRMSWDNLRTMKSAGQEIGGHGKTHSLFDTLTEAQIIEELTYSNTAFIANGLPAPVNMAYPAGNYNTAIKNTVKNFMHTATTVDAVFYPIKEDSDKMSLNRIAIDNLSDAGLVTIKSYLDICKQENGAMVIYSHGISDLGGTWECSAARFSAIIDYAQSNGIEIVTMERFYSALDKNEYVPNNYDLSIAATGNGSGITQVNLIGKEDTVFAITGNARFYDDAACTVNESANWVFQSWKGGTGKYLKCTSGTSVLTIDKNKLVGIRAWTSGINAATLGGSIEPLTNLNFITAVGNNTLSGNISQHSKLTTLAVSGSTTITGSLALLTRLNYIEVGGSNTLSGNLSNHILLTYLSIGGLNTCSGDIALLTLLQLCNMTGNSTFTYSNCSNIRGLSRLIISNVVLTSANVNQILADHWLNRDYPKPLSWSRLMSLLGATGSGAPTGQGITDKAALLAYKSPNMEADKLLWTVSTR